MSEFNNLIGMLNDKNDIILSQQAKIAELQAKYDELNNRATGIALDQMATAIRNQALQGRIDEALKELELLNYYRTRNSDNAINILKGNKDE